MEELKKKILKEGKNLGGGILKVNTFLNHQIDSHLMVLVGRGIADQFWHYHPTKVLTAEISGIAPAVQAGVFLDAPVVFARRVKSITMPDEVYIRTVPSHTKGGTTDLIVAAEMLTPQDRILIVDDFLATGKTIEALASIVEEAGAELVGIGAVIEKSFEGGRERLAHLGVPIEALAIVEKMEGDEITIV